MKAALCENTRCELRLTPLDFCIMNYSDNEWSHFDINILLDDKLNDLTTRMQLSRHLAADSSKPMATDSIVVSQVAIYAKRSRPEPYVIKRRKM